MKEKEFFMRIAIEEAKKALSIGEVPVGAVVVKDNEIIGKGYNLRESNKDPTLHAEIVAIREAAKNIGDWRLNGCELFVTIEPCPMCAGAIILSRIDKVYFGARDPKMGVVVSNIEIFTYQFNHKVKWEEGILKEECENLIKNFFKNLREGKIV